MKPSKTDNYTKMTETPVWRLTLRLAVPTTVSMLITSLYNTADTFFVSKISVTASGATGIVFALMTLLQAFGFMFGHGAGSNISRLLGAKENEKASVFSSTSFFLAAGTGTLFLIFGIIFIEPFMYLLGSTPTILTDAKAYALWILIGAPALILSCVLNNILRYEGLAAYAMVGLTSGGILNMVLDPILIFVCKLGVHGAGLSTAISQYIALFILLKPFLSGKTSSKIALKYFTKEFSIIGNIIMTGFPNLLRQGLTGISTTILNTLASAYGDVAIASFGIVTRCANMLFSFAIGLAQGFQPVAAFNYGAKKYKRVKNAAVFTFSTAIALVAVICLVCYTNAGSVITLFRSEKEIIEIGSQALKYMCFGLVLLPVSAVGSMLFQSTGQKGRATFVASLQSGILFIPYMFILSHFFGLKGLEASQPASYATAAVITFPLILSFLLKLNRLKNE